VQESVEQEWTEERDASLKRAYQKKRSDIWTVVAKEMGFQEDWRCIEAKIFEIGLKKLK
jgi:hypothetical protein